MATEIHTALETLGEVEVPSEKRGRRLVSHNSRKDFILSLEYDVDRHRNAYEPNDRQTDKQTNKQTNKHTETKTNQRSTRQAS